MEIIGPNTCEGKAHVETLWTEFISKWADSIYISMRSFLRSEVILYCTILSKCGCGRRQDSLPLLKG